MNFRFQADAGHPHRIADTILFVDDVELGQGMEDLPVEGDGDRPGGFDRPLNIIIVDLSALDGDDAEAVLSPDVAARDADVDRADLAARDALRLFHRALDRFHGAFDVDDDAFSQPFRRDGSRCR